MAKKKRNADSSSHGDRRSDKDYVKDRTRRRKGYGDTSGDHDSGTGIDPTEKLELKRQADIRNALLKLGEEDKSNEELIDDAFAEVEKRARGFEIDAREIAFVREYFKEFTITDPDVARMAADWMTAAKDASEEDLKFGFASTTADLLISGFERKKEQLLALQKDADNKPIRGKTATDRRELIDRIEESYREDPIGAISRLEQALRDFGVVEAEIDVLHDPTLPSAEEILVKKKEEFDRLAAILQAKIETYALVEKDAAETKAEIEEQINKARLDFNSDPDSALSVLKELHADLELAKPSEQQMLNLVGRYRELLSSPYLDPDFVSNWNQYVDNYLENFKTDSANSFLEMDNAFESVKEVADQQILHHVLLDNLKTLFLKIKGVETLAQLGKPEKRQLKRITDGWTTDFKNDPEASLVRLAQEVENRDAELNFRNALNSYLAERSTMSFNMGEKKVDVKARAGDAKASYLEQYTNNNDEAIDRLIEQRELVKDINSYAEMLSARGVRSRGKYNFVGQYHDLRISEDGEENEMANERLLIEKIFAEYLLRAAAAGVRKGDIRDLKDTVNQAIEAGEHLGDLIEFLQEKVEELPPVVEEDTEDDDTVRAVIEGDVDEDDDTEIIDTARTNADDTGGIGARTIAAGAAAAGAVAAGAAAIASRDSHDGEKDSAEVVQLHTQAEVAETPNKNEEKKSLLTLPFRAVGMVGETAWWPVEKVYKNKSVQKGAMVGGGVVGGALYAGWKAFKGLWGFGRKLIGLDEVKILGDEEKKKKAA